MFLKISEQGYEKIMEISHLKIANSSLQAVYEKNIEDALAHDDFVKLRRVFLCAARIKMLPEGASGYDHCERLWTLLDLLACDRFDNVYRVLPRGLPVSANGYPMYVHGTNLLLCILYHSGNETVYPADKIIDKAEKFAVSKKPLWERAVISCLLGIMQSDTQRVTDSLWQICTGFGKIDTAKYMKMQCQNAYGLVVIAKHFLSEGVFSRIVYPECKNFSKGYISWFLEQEELTLDSGIAFDPLLEEFDGIIRKQIAITRVCQPYLNSDNPYLSAKEKKAYYMDGDRMLAEFMQETQDSPVQAET